MAASGGDAGVLPPPSGPPLGAGIPPPDRAATAGVPPPHRAATAAHLAGTPGAVVPLRPLTVGDTLDSIVRILRRAAAPIAVLVLAVVWPDLLLRDALLARTAPLPTANLDPDELLMTTLDGAGWWLLSMVVGLYVGVVVSGAIVAALSARDRSTPIGAWAALGVGLRRSGATFGATLIGVGLVIAVLFVVTIAATIMGIVIPIVGFLVMLPVLLLVALVGLVVSILVIPVAIEEGTGPWRTVTRTLTLLRWRLWWVLGVTLLVLLLLLAVAGALLVLGGLLMDLLGGAAWVLETLGSVLLAAVATPLLAATGFVIHREVRVRVEGFDLTVRTRGLRGEPVW